MTSSRIAGSHDPAWIHRNPFSKRKKTRDARPRPLDFDSLLPGHHSISPRDDRRHVQKADWLFRVSFVPRSIV